MKITVTGQTTFVKRVTIGTPVSSVNEAASGSVSGTGRSTGDILVVKSGTNLYEPGELVGSHGIVKAHNTSTNDLVLSVDSDEIKSIIDSGYVKFITGQDTTRNFVDSAYVEANSLDSERTNNLLDSELGALRVSLVPYNDSAIDLGDSSRKFRDLYLSGSTIHLGGLIIGDENTAFTVRDSAGAAASISLAGNTTTDLAEGNNLYYTTARADSAARSAMVIVDAGGDGSLAYDSSLGKITYTGPSAAEVRAHLNGGHGIVYSTSTGNISVDSSEVRGLFSAGGDLSYNAGTGQFSFDVESVYTQANFESDLSLSLNATNGIAYDSARHKLSLINTGVDSAIYGSSTRVPILTINAQGRVDSAGSVLVAGVTGFSLDSASGVLTISTADGGSFSAPIHSRDSAELFEISGSSINYDSGSINQFTATNITADSAVITDISGTSVNVTTGLISQLSADSARATNFTAATATIDSAIITDISGTTVNFTTGLISQLSADSARATVLTTPSLSADSARIINASGTGLNYTTAHLANITGDSARIGNMTITGDLTVSGTQTTINTQTVKVHDPIIHLADSNEISDVVDLGFVGKYYRDGQQRHTGLIRDASNEQYYLFRDVVDSSLDSSLTINRSATGFAKADLNVANLLADSATMTNLTVTGLSTTSVTSTTLTRAAPNVDSDTYGSSTKIPVMTVNTSGFIDSIGEVLVAGVTAVAYDSDTATITISTADGGSFTTVMRGFNDSSPLFFGDSSDFKIVREQYDTILREQTGTLFLSAPEIKLADETGNDPVLIHVGSAHGVKLNDSEGNLILNTRKYGVEGRGKLTFDSADFTVLKIGGEVVNNAMFVDSAYVEQVSLDSERARNLIDSDYLAERIKNLEGNITITTARNDAAAGPVLKLKTTTTSAADSDLLGEIVFESNDSGSNAEEYAKIRAVIDDATTSSEDGTIETLIKDGGSFITATRLRKSGFHIGHQIPLSLTGELILNGEIVDSSFVNLRAKDITTNQFKVDLVDAGATAGPNIVLDRNSSSPADSDALANIEFRGRNSSDSAISYAKISAHINDATADTEDAEMHFVLTQSGVQRTKMKFTPTGIVLAGNERVAFSDDSFHQLLTPGDYTSDHALTLPDSTGTIMTREFITTLVDSNYVALRQGASIINLEIDDSAGDQKLLVPITQAAVISTGSAIGFGNTISVLLADSSAFTISL